MVSSKVVSYIAVCYVKRSFSYSLVVVYLISSSFKMLSTIFENQPARMVHPGYLCLLNCSCLNHQCHLILPGLKSKSFSIINLNIRIIFFVYFNSRNFKCASRLLSNVLCLPCVSPLIVISTIFFPFSVTQPIEIMPQRKKSLGYNSFWKHSSHVVRVKPQ